MKKTINFILAGVGGQGTILASDVLVNVGLAAGYHAKQAEVHGMSQRGGSVSSHVRWGEVVHSPLVGFGEADVMLAFEKAEALRNLTHMRPGGLALVNLQEIFPLTVTSGGQPYPSDEHLRTCLSAGVEAVYIDGQAIAEEMGNPRVANVALLGALEALLEMRGYTGTEMTTELWLQVISERVPRKYTEVNRRAFQAGQQAVAPAK